jgi:hypothetical protein
MNARSGTPWKENGGELSSCKRGPADKLE